MAETNSLSLIEINTADNKTTKYAINEMVLAILLQHIPVNFGGISRAQNALTLLTDRIILAFYKAKLDAQANGINDKITVWLEHFQNADVNELYNFTPATYDGATHTLNDLADHIPIELTEVEWQKIIDVIPKTTEATQQKLFADQIKLVSTAVLECYKKLDAGQKLAVDAKNKDIIMNKVNNNDAIAVAAAAANPGAPFGGPANIRVDFINSGIVYAAPAIAAADADTALATELDVTPFADKPANWNFKMWCSLLVKIAIDGVDAPAPAETTVAEVIDIKYTGNDTKSLLFDKFEKDNYGKIDKFWKEYLLSTGESKLTGGKRTKRRRTKKSSKRRSQKKSRKIRKIRKRSNKRKGKKSKRRMRKSYKK
jgi:hypothetical protein